jgi:thiol-disulfide isomerase/thioredoxin
MKFSTLRIILAAGIAMGAFPACNTEGGQVHLKGKLQNMPGRTVTMSYDGASSILGNSRDITLYLDAEGCFDTVISLKKPAYYNISRNTVYLTPGDELTMKITQRNKDAEFLGKGAEANNYLKERLFPHAGSFLGGGVNMKNSFESTRRMIDSMALARRTQLTSLENVSEEFKRLENARISADVLNSYNYYPIYANIHAKNKNIPELAIRRHQVDSFYLAISEDMKSLAEELNDESVLDVAVARSVLDNLLSNRQMQSWAEGIAFVPEVQELVMAAQWADKLNEYLDAESISLATAYANNMKDREMAKELLSKIHQSSRLLNGPAIDFSLTDVEGNSCRLSDFKGKVLYIDLWATWCGPCVKESPYFESLAKEYEGKDIVFLAISTDNSKKTWKKYLESNPKKLPQYHSTDPALKEGWAIKYIPRFILINKDFNIADAYAPRPSEDSIREKLEYLLK